jgi:hypothetical protein
MYTEYNDERVKQLIELSELNPIVAKSHYHETGTLRWFSRSLIQVSMAKDYLNNFTPLAGSAGEFILIAPSLEFGPRKNKNIVQENQTQEIIKLDATKLFLDEISRQLQ